MNSLQYKYYKLSTTLFSRNPKLQFNFFCPRGIIILADQMSVNFITVHGVVLEEIAQKEIEVAFYKIHKII